MTPPRHPRTFDVAVLVPLVLLSAAGAVIGLQLLTSLGITLNTALIGAAAAMLVGRLPVGRLRVFRSIHAQNLAQSATSAATFGAANSLLLPIAVPFVLGRPDLVPTMLVGAACAMFLDAFLLYRMFGSRLFPADGAWPHGLAAAEAIRAGDQGGRQGRVLMASVAGGACGAWLGVPMSAFGTAFIGNVWALAMFGLGLLAASYSAALTGVSLQAAFVPHGMMIGAGLVAMGQVVGGVRVPHDRSGPAVAASSARTRRALGYGALGFIVIAAGLALASGLAAEMSLARLALFVMFAAVSAFAHELLVGLAAMHSGWFPAFAVALITLLIGLLLGFPPHALGLLTGFAVSTGPAFADMGYDLKAGYVLRGRGADPAFELEGRREQFLAACVAFATALFVVAVSWRGYFARDLVPPVARVYATTIGAGVAPTVAASLAWWAAPGALLQWLGGPRRQLGVLLATGLLIANPRAGWGVLAGIAVRLAWAHVLRRPPADLEVVAAGFIAGDAVFSFGESAVRQARTPGAITR